MNADWPIGAWKMKCVSTRMEVTTVCPDQKILCGECKNIFCYNILMYTYEWSILKVNVCCYVKFF